MIAQKNKNIGQIVSLMYRKTNMTGKSIVKQPIVRHVINTFIVGSLNGAHTKKNLKKELLIIVFSIKINLFLKLYSAKRNQCKNPCWLVSKYDPSLPSWNCATVFPTSQKGVRHLTFHCTKQWHFVHEVECGVDLQWLCCRLSRSCGRPPVEARPPWCHLRVESREGLDWAAGCYAAAGLAVPGTQIKTQNENSQTDRHCQGKRNYLQELLLQAET